MNKYQKFGIVMMVIGAVAPIAIAHLSYKFSMAKTIAEIDAETKADIAASRKAKLIVEDLIKRGHYKNRSFVDVEKDFYFYRIAARFED